MFADKTMELSPVKARLECKPILLDVKNTTIGPGDANSRFSTGGRPVLPDELASDIQHFAQREFARQYFMTHKTGFIFKKKVPVEKMMVWQKVRSSFLNFLSYKGPNSELNCRCSPQSRPRSCLSIASTTRRP